jgi:predicted TIM-barrel fold metal-dependent hydrolase
MDSAGVDACVLVPLEAPGPDTSANNPPAVEMARAHPDRFKVMGRFDLTAPGRAPLLERWRTELGMLGVRLAFVREPNQGLLRNGALNWFWSAAEENGVPVMLLLPDMVERVEPIAAHHPKLKLVVDHMGLTPDKQYSKHELKAAIEPLLKLSGHDNVAVKLTALPNSVAEAYPFVSLHESVLKVVNSFGRERSFWGSDLSRLRCPYSECIRMFSEALPFSAMDKEWIMGRGVSAWLGWNA